MNGIVLTSTQQDIVNIINECGGRASAYQIQLHAKKTRPYGFDTYFISNIDNRIQQLKRRGVVKYDASMGKWVVVDKAFTREREEV